MFEISMNVLITIMLLSLSGFFTLVGIGSYDKHDKGPALSFFILAGMFSIAHLFIHGVIVVVD